MKQVVYISGPITGVENYRAAFDQEQALLTDEGYIVVNPARAFDGQTGIDYQKYMRFHVATILTVDKMVMLPGWKQSRGATFEKALAEMIGLPVMTRFNGNLHFAW